MASIETRAFLGDLVKGMTAKFAMVFDQAKESYSLAISDAVATAGNKQTALFKQKSTDAARERTASKAGTGYLELTPEGQPFAQDSRLIGYTTTWVPAKFTSGVTVTLENIQDRDYQAQLDEYSDLTVSGQETKDRDAFWLLGKYAFTAQASVPSFYSQYGDAKPLCSTTHPRKDGGTAQSNASATGLPFSETALETARLAIMGQLMDNGKPMRVGTGKLILVVPPALEKAAVVVTKGEKRSGTANNDINIYDGLFTVISSQYISAAQGGSDTQWFVIDPRVAKLCFYLRKDLSTSRYIDNRTKDVTFDIYGRWTIGYGDWRGVWGSKGDAAAYSA
jgi:hypothetical protein